MSKSDYLEESVLNAVLRGAAWPVSGASVYLALFKDYVGETNLGTEVSGGSYARAAVSRASGSWNAPTTSGAAKLTANTSAITFPNATADWGIVNGIGVYDAASGGNLLYHSPLSTSRDIKSGDFSISFAAGQITVSEA